MKVQLLSFSLCNCKRSSAYRLVAWSKDLNCTLGRMLKHMQRNARCYSNEAIATGQHQFRPSAPRCCRIFRACSPNCTPQAIFLLPDGIPRQHLFLTQGSKTSCDAFCMFMKCIHYLGWSSSHTDGHGLFISQFTGQDNNGHFCFDKKKYKFVVFWGKDVLQYCCLCCYKCSSLDTQTCFLIKQEFNILERSSQAVISGYMACISIWTGWGCYIG